MYKALTYTYTHRICLIGNLPDSLSVKRKWNSSFAGFKSSSSLCDVVSLFYFAVSQFCHL